MKKNIPLWEIMQVLTLFNSEIPNKKSNCKRPTSEISHSDLRTKKIFPLGKLSTLT